MNINDADVQDKIVAVEGQDWLYEQASNAHNGEGEYTLAWAKKAYAKHIAHVEVEHDAAVADGDEQEAEYQLNMLEKAHSTGIIIYGRGGVHRYMVMGDGSLMFSRGHAGDFETVVAMRVGFRTT